jgi:hypothetical protein
MVRQMGLDVHIKQLVDILDKVFLFLLDADQLKDIMTQGSESQLEVLKLIFKQTTECGHYICAYAKDTSYCKLSACIFT